MTPQAFLDGIASLELFFKAAKLGPRDRLVYQNALADLTDQQWADVVAHAQKVWKYARVPEPAHFLEWAGVKVESPAEAAQRTLFDGTPVVEGTPLADVFREVETRGVGRVSGSFWKSTEERLAYEYATEEVLRATPMPKMLSPDWILGRIQLISLRAQESLAKMALDKAKEAR